MIFEKLVAVLADHVDCDPSSVTMDTTFEELGVDSLDTVDMVMELEEELGIELELDEKISTVGEKWSNWWKKKWARRNKR